MPSSSNIVRIDLARLNRSPQGPDRQPPATPGDRGRFHGNQFTRRQVLGVLFATGSLRKAAKAHPFREAGLAAEIIDALTEKRAA